MGCKIYFHAWSSIILIIDAKQLDKEQFGQKTVETQLRGVTKIVNIFIIFKNTSNFLAVI